MPDVSRDPAAIYVWESVVQPGEYALCTDRHHRDFQNEHWWRFLGELATISELNGFQWPSVASGWPMRVRRDPSGGDGVGA